MHFNFNSDMLKSSGLEDLVKEFYEPNYYRIIGNTSDNWVKRAYSVPGFSKDDFKTEIKGEYLLITGEVDHPILGKKNIKIPDVELKGLERVDIDVTNGILVIEKIYDDKPKVKINIK